MMRFTGLGVGHLEYEARAIHALTVEDEPNWLELCPAKTAEASDPLDVESEDESESDDTGEEDLDSYTF